mmetsp:Transcript_13548/g.18935  ORF Transcript_13548/g.18935 Transcript_13548/m.18935 type:complete len:125 (+) Transcript_13548:607-981(+)
MDSNSYYLPETRHITAQQNKGDTSHHNIAQESKVLVKGSKRVTLAGQSGIEVWKRVNNDNSEAMSQESASALALWNGTLTSFDWHVRSSLTKEHYRTKGTRSFSFSYFETPKNTDLQSIDSMLR